MIGVGLGGKDPPGLASVDEVNIAMIDTQNNSIQSLNFGKNGFNSIIDSILVSQNSIQTIIQFKNNCGDSIQ